MKTTFDIPDSVYRDFKVTTATNDETMRSVLLAFIRAYNQAGRNPLKVEIVPCIKTQDSEDELPSWAGLAEPFITKRPRKPLDNEALRDEIIAARRKGLS